MNAANRDNPNYGRVPNEQPSGHWLYSFLRHDLESSQTFLVVANLNPREALKNVRIILSRSAARSIALDERATEKKIYLRDRLTIDQPLYIETNVAEATSVGIPIVELPTLTPFYFEMSIVGF